MNIKRKNNMTLMIIIAAAAVLFIAGSTFAYFTDSVDASNKFTVGDISLELHEPEWNENNGKNLVPCQTVKKDPEVLNDGVNDAFVFMSVDVPYADIRTANEDGTLNSAADTELFTYEINEGWKEIASEKADGIVEHVYAYTGDGSDMKKLKPGEKTPSLFDSVTFANVVEGEIDSNAALDIDVRSYGIQAENIGNSSVPEHIWSVLNNSIKPQ